MFATLSYRLRRFDLADYCNFFDSPASIGAWISEHAQLVFPDEAAVRRDEIDAGAAEAAFWAAKMRMRYGIVQRTLYDKSVY